MTPGETKTRKPALPPDTPSGVSAARVHRKTGSACTWAAETPDGVSGGSAGFRVLVSPGVIEQAETGGSQLRLCQEQRVAVSSALFDSLLANIVASRGIEIPGRNGQTSQGLDLGLSESCFGRARRRG